MTQLYDTDEKPLTIAELIAQLQTFPPDFLVFTEGCDCLGVAAEVQQQDDDAVLISRTKAEADEMKTHNKYDPQTCCRDGEAARRLRARTRLEARGVQPGADAVSTATVSLTNEDASSYPAEKLRR